MKLLTSGDVARICGVAPRTVSKWCDSGKLKSFRIPGSLHRRIVPEDLLAFLKENGMPIRPADGEDLWNRLVARSAK